MKPTRTRLFKVLLQVLPLSLICVPIAATPGLAESQVPTSQAERAIAPNRGLEAQTVSPPAPTPPVAQQAATQGPPQNPSEEVQPATPATQTASNSTPQSSPSTSTSAPNPTSGTTPTPPSAPNQPEIPKTPDTTKPAETAKPDEPGTPDATKTPEELAHQQKLAEADRLYQAGKFAEAEKLYRQVKAPFSNATPAQEQKAQPFSDPELLSRAGKVYWREAQAGLEKNLETRIFVPLKLLVEQVPEFVPGHLTLAKAWESKGKIEEAVAVLDRAANLYPNQPELLRARIVMLEKTEQWIEASIAARQFALLHPNDPAAAEFTALADENLKRYQGQLRSKLTGNLIGGILTGALGYAVTGSLFGPLSAIQTTALLLRGESAVGERYAKQAERQLKMVEDQAVLDYVNEIGQKLAKASGRNDFQYEFQVVLEDDLNAFALPGGKVFVNAGAIAKSQSEAEFAGLLAHELAHAILSHGFQLVTQENLTANVFQFIPLGGLISNLVVLNYSREMEQQADILGTRLLAATGYAADGLRNLMVTLAKEDKRAPAIDFLSTHPVTTERTKYLEALISSSGYNRYAYEGIERHGQIRDRVNKLLKDKKKRDEKIRDERQQEQQDNF